MSKLEIEVLSGVGYSTKSTGPSTAPRGTPYEIVATTYYGTMTWTWLTLKN